ncbi:MAG: Peroxisome biosynthesis protein pex1 [Trizodia sp. TS-e1964]|nr:MAG: Peroxisome biosynthesis protein pex1 [Trizodia sp. TS-e1964]
MASSSRKSAQPATSAVVVFAQLRSCLVNLPSSLVSILVNANTPAQNIVVELSYRASQDAENARVNSRSTSKSNKQTPSLSAFVGWTGLPSQRRLTEFVRIGSVGRSKANVAGKEQEGAAIEIDAAFGRTLGLVDGQKVNILLHADPPLALTVNIEPITPADWEIIELHANFLELNLLSQIRALPNPSFSHGQGPPQVHPLILHLSPTSTANITVTSLLPSPPSSYAFAKLSPDAEVIVAPRPHSRPLRGKENEGSFLDKKSTGGRSGASKVRAKSLRDEGNGLRPLFFRGAQRNLAGKWFDETLEDTDSGLKVWIDEEKLASRNLRGATWVCVSILRLAALYGPIDPQRQSVSKLDVPEHEIWKQATRVVAKILPWENAPDSQHVALSSALCMALGFPGFVGGIVKVEPAPSQLEKKIIKGLEVYPFIRKSERSDGALKIRNESAAKQDEARRKIKAMFSPIGGGNSLLDGPLTNGLVLYRTSPKSDDDAWDGVICRFKTSTAGPTESEDTLWCWCLAADRKLSFEYHNEIVSPPAPATTLGDPLPADIPTLVGIDNLAGQLISHLSHSSSVLLTGGLGSGKSSLACLVAHRLRSENLFHATYYPCKRFVAEEARVSTIKETLTRLFMAASWGARLAGHSIVILDDLDRLCPAETELQAGGENGRSRQISEGIRSIIRQYCTMHSGVVLLATSQGKEALHNVLVGGHIIREILTIKSPQKDARAGLIEGLVKIRTSKPAPSRSTTVQKFERSLDSNLSADGPLIPAKENVELCSSTSSLDFLHLAGQTDGYMPGDLVLLVARAWSEAIIRELARPISNAETSRTNVEMEDFDMALKGFTPASLRNVTLQSSSTTFDSIGGLHSTRKILLETLQYPTIYAPIFAQCPLRLRSGLLLYGYPGCGKTLLASAVAGECGLNFISVKGPEILNKYIGASEKSVRDLFERAEAARPCVLFFDEFDSIAPKRGHDSTGVTDRVVNQLLTQMDGAEGLSGVYILAATSRPDLIDPALLRPGRLDKSLLCDLPDQSDRIDILRAFSRKINMSSDVVERLDKVAVRTEGYSGADLQAVAYNAHLEAIHDLIGDQDSVPAKGGKKSAYSKKQLASKSGRSNRDFFQFKFGESEADTESENSDKNSSKQLAAREEILATLAAIKLARRRERQMQRGDVPENETAEMSKNQGPEVVVEWRHMEASLKQTRSSITTDERRRLHAIYREFVVGRNGEMHDGQGPTDVGGRSSLM